ncbi:uncharacterized protein VTP21DRAFT_8732 [Calcarisporiella thermophila]|uniref:uncharacterized protein n=1 Tax=Calcarisporiella thermophila TaxID=911321 RepID=UPI0037436823
MRGRRILYVTGFASDVRARDLAYEFERYGPLVRCDISRSYKDDRPIAFVEFEDPRDAQDAWHQLHGRRVGEYRIRLQWARNPPRYDRRRSRSPPRRRRYSLSPRRRYSPSPRRRYRSPSPRKYSRSPRRHESRSPQKRESLSPRERSRSPRSRSPRSLSPRSRSPSRSPSSRRDSRYSRSPKQKSPSLSPRPQEDREEESI